MTVREFITECDMYEHSADNYRITKLLSEISLIETAINAYEFNRATGGEYNQYVETVNILTEEEEVAEAKKSLWDKIKEGAKAIWANFLKLLSTIGNFFAGPFKKRVDETLSEEAVKARTEKAKEISDVLKNANAVMDNEHMDDLRSSGDETIKGIHDRHARANAHMKNLCDNIETTNREIVDILANMWRTMDKTKNDIDVSFGSIMDINDEIIKDLNDKADQLKNEVKTEKEKRVIGDFQKALRTVLLPDMELTRVSPSLQKVRDAINVTSAYEGDGDNPNVVKILEMMAELENNEYVKGFRDIALRHLGNNMMSDDYEKFAKVMDPEYRYKQVWCVINEVASSSYGLIPARDPEGTLKSMNEYQTTMNMVLDNNLPFEEEAEKFLDKFVKAAYRRTTMPMPSPDYYGDVINISVHDFKEYHRRITDNMTNINSIAQSFCDKYSKEEVDKHVSAGTKVGEYLKYVDKYNSGMVKGLSDIVKFYGSMLNGLAEFDKVIDRMATEIGNMT